MVGEKKNLSEFFYDFVTRAKKGSGDGTCDRSNFFSPPTLFNDQTSSSSCFLAFQFIFEIDFGSAFAAVARETEKPSLRRRRSRLSESNVEAEKMVLVAQQRWRKHGAREHEKERQRE